jgi:hypothetical protein
MAGEYIQADTIKEYWKNLKAYFQAQSPFFQEISKEEYDQIDRSEREDSDNHLNQDRLGEDTKVSDASFYKYLTDGKTAYRTHLVDVDGQQEIHYFLIQSFE